MDTVHEKNAMTKCENEFKDSFEVIQCHIKLCRFDYERI
jgi:hypothetical protein